MEAALWYRVDFPWLAEGYRSIWSCPLAAIDQAPGTLFACTSQLGESETLLEPELHHVGQQFVP